MPSSLSFDSKTGIFSYAQELPVVVPKVTYLATSFKTLYISTPFFFNSHDSKYTTYI